MVPVSAFYCPYSVDAMIGLQEETFSLINCCL